MGPELFLPEKFGLGHSRPTKCSDCYALGMVIYEVLSGGVPFRHYGRYVVVAKVLEGERPERPRGPEGVWFTDDAWRVTGDCWKPVPGDRPSIPNVLRRLKKLTPPHPEIPGFIYPLATEEGADVGEVDEASSPYRAATPRSPQVLQSQGDRRCYTCARISLT